LRFLHDNKKCPICKEEHEQIVADRPGKSFDEYPIWGNDLGSNYVYRENVGMFLPTDYYHEVVEPLFGYQCTVSKCGYDGTVPDVNIYDQMQEELEAQQNGDGSGNHEQQQQQQQQQQQKKKNGKSKRPPTPLRALQDHLRIKHRLTLCQLCIDNKRDFVAALPRFAPHQLKKHLTKGDGPGSGFEGHPICEFCCPKRFYDLTQLHLHLQKDHYKCHVCEKRGQPNQYFRNYQSLEKHFDRQHFLCQDPQCLAARFVVFENEIDFHAHERQVHGRTTAGSTKIQLEFQTRRAGYGGSGVAEQQEAPSEDDFNFGLQGEAFVPAAMPRSGDVTLHPLHLQRTAEFREHASQIRQQQQQETEGASFPTLQAATGGNEGGEGGQQFNLGWTSGTSVAQVARRKKNAGAVTEDDFPTLPSGTKKSSASSKLRAGTGPSNRQLNAIRAVAAQPAVSAGGGWGSTAAAAAVAPSASYQYNVSAFPPAPSSRPLNRTENLAPGNFPSLGGGSKKAARNPVTSKLVSRGFTPRQPPPLWNSSLDFPAPSAGADRKPAPTSAAAPRQKPPSVNSQEDFPAPPTASGKNATKNKALGKKQLSQSARNNMLQIPKTSVKAPEDPQDTLRDMQASLGPAKYKKLKKFTREFAQGELDPDAYIDHAASLFDRGYSDSEFWKTIPLLVASCPNQSSANEALQYMESLRTKSAPNVEPVNLMAAPETGNQWNAAPLNLTPQSFPTPSVVTRPAPPANRGKTTTTRYILPTGKKKGAWGNGAGAGPTIKQVKATAPVSVGSAVANQAPQGGTATKFMAKETKQQNAAQNSASQQLKNKNKKSQKAELRELAFGGR